MTGELLATGDLFSKKLRLARGEPIAKRYIVSSWLGTEGLANLYEARHARLGRIAVVKFVDEASGFREEREQAAREMRHEALTCSMVEHPNIAHVLDFGTTSQEEAFLVRERYHGGTLGAALRLSGALPFDDVNDLFVQILSGLHALHQMGIVHRDLGTHHVTLVERTGCRPIVKIAGLSTALAPSLDGLTFAPAPHYAAPEVLRGAPATERSDLYSCGVMLYEMLAGRRPFEAATVDEVRASVLHDTPPSLSELRARLDPGWLPVLERTLARDPQDRYASALALLHALPSHGRPTARLRSLAESNAGEDTLVTPWLNPEGASPAQLDDTPSSPRTLGLTPQCDPWIGQRIGDKYLVQSLLGSGSAGAVYRAKHVELDRLVAIKVLHAGSQGHSFARRFKAEALAASQLAHPNITQVIDFGHERDGTPYLVMEYVDGSSLEAILDTEGRLDQWRAVHLAVQICSSLATAHAAGIIHRDIKPENIMVTRTRDSQSAADVVKVCDFGLAKFNYDGAETTKTGRILGSPAYMAPEQARGAACDARADIYAVGVTLFEMLTGHLPHEASTVAECFDKKREQEARRVSSLVPEVDPLIDDIVAHALVADPTHRHATAADLGLELREALALAPRHDSTKSHVTIWPEG